MARTRLGLAKAVEEILERYGENGRRLSLRQAERLTGLSPATIGELAKGNARTADTVRRFAQGMGEEVDRLLLLAGFTPADLDAPPEPELTSPADETDPFGRLDLAAKLILERWACAFLKMPAGRDRDLLLERLRLEAELLERLGGRKA